MYGAARLRQHVSSTRTLWHASPGLRRHHCATTARAHTHTGLGHNSGGAHDTRAQPADPGRTTLIARQRAVCVRARAAASPPLTSWCRCTPAPLGPVPRRYVLGCYDQSHVCGPQTGPRVCERVRARTRAGAGGGLHLRARLQSLRTERGGSRGAGVPVQGLS